MAGRRPDAKSRPVLVDRIVRTQRPNNGIVYRLWPHDTLTPGESYDVVDPRKWRTAKNSAYQFGRRYGITYRCRKVFDEIRDRWVLRIERMD